MNLTVEPTIIHNMIRPFAAALIGMAGTAGGGLLENHTMDIKTVCAVGSVVLAGAWTISRRFTRLEDRIADVEHAIKVMPCTKVPVVALATVKCDVVKPDEKEE